MVACRAIHETHFKFGSSPDTFYIGFFFVNGPGNIVAGCNGMLSPRNILCMGGFLFVFVRIYDLAAVSLIKS